MESLLTTDFIKNAGAAGTAIIALVWTIRYLANQFQTSLEKMGERFEQREAKQAETYKETIIMLTTQIQTIVNQFQANSSQIDSRHDNIEKELVLARNLIEQAITLLNKVQTKQEQTDKDLVSVTGKLNTVLTELVYTRNLADQLKLIKETQTSYDDKGVNNS